MSEPQPSERPLEPAPPEPATARLVNVQFRRAAATLVEFDAGDLDLPHDTRVIVESAYGEALGWTVGPVEAREALTEGPLRRVLRVATERDLARDVELQAKEREALRFCALRARQLGLQMKLVACEWQHSGRLVAFYFSAETWVDFRALVRELAQRYRARVEMRQLTDREAGRAEAKIIGAMGPCGRETCCSSWLRGFAPVTIKMAKDQGLALNPQKTLGVCGHLLCCLAYEQDTYKELRRRLPRLGKQVNTPQGPGKVVDVLALRGAVRVALQGSKGPGQTFLAEEVTPLGAAEAKGEVPAKIDKPKVDKPKVDKPKVEKPKVEKQAKADRPAKPGKAKPAKAEKPKVEKPAQAPAPEGEGTGRRRRRRLKERPPAPQAETPVKKPVKTPPPEPAKSVAADQTGEQKPGGRHARRRRRLRGKGEGDAPSGES